MTALLEDADEAVRLVSADARAAARLASSVLSSSVDLEASSTAERALGLAAIEFGDAEAAVSHLRRAVSLAVDGGYVRREGEARMSLSWALTQQGAIGEGLVEADRALPVLDGSALARLQMQRALILQRLGRFAEALEGYRRPLAAFRRAGDTLWEARLLNNRGVLQVHRGALAAAEADLQRAIALHEADDRGLAATQVRHNLGWVAARRGDVPLSLSLFDRVEAEYRVHDVPLALLFMDRCDVLLSARLASEARANAVAAVAELESAGMGSDLAEAQLLAAQAELLCGDSAAAREHALAADAAFVAQRRPAWSALARAAAAQAAWMDVGVAATTGASGDATVEFLEESARNSTLGAREARLEVALGEARRAIRSLDAAGWGVEALDARLIAGRAALELGRPRLARRQLELAAAARERGPVLQRTRAWHAAALLRLSKDDRRGAGAAVAAGLRALEAHRITLGATELRAHASGHGEELATLGLRLAVESGSARRVLAAAERRRATALLERPARPPDDEELASELAELRRVSAALDESLRDGRPDASLTRRQAALERSVRRRALRTRGGATANINGVRPPLETLGDRTLVEFFALDGRLHAVTVTGGRPALHRLGAEADVNKEVASLRFSLRSLATARPGSRAADAMAGICATVAQRLDTLLIAPLKLADGPLVLVPTGELHALPWSMLPSLAHRPLSVAPSLRLWQRANAAPPAAGAVLAAGPRLPAATEEIETLTRRHPHAVALTGAQATVANVASALDGADTAHLAAHGHFRDDNPSFCSLELADGALTVYDLERLNKTPRRLVLSSCESGLSTVHAGDELMGFTAAMFSLGTATVIAAVVPVPDEATKGLMLALDDELRTGTPPAAALVRARDAIDEDENRLTAARAAFVCFGAG
ncbi:CHAT domain-containing protein [Solirubrobacter ginsenosidimutans]|uniref:CHAT domain-containing protein n=1 Tax=Solirubrobacter ginsenosidimutans TaxID=490573 RepID=A0A9X3S4F6_9ACTN|nr:CHAT domain-containing tetratricopeptide repeat protein [Solirubrobacter ginsenosidimutans]MDA0166635.1 CHAT domain-containing protein [Solirubrobacter ginsenosidimutans]